MKPPLAPLASAGGTEAGRMDYAVEALFAAAKVEFKKQETRLKARQEPKMRPKKDSPSRALSRQTRV